MVSFPPQQNNKNGINLRLVSRAGGDGGEPCHPPPAPLNYSVDREEKGELQGSTNQLYYPYKCSV